jgi:hypothetical protein
MSVRFLAGMGLVMLVGASCSLKIDPNIGTYSCGEKIECGPGYDCRPQFTGGGRCFKAGLCQEIETCDGTDENCDGRVDEVFDGIDAGCQLSGLLGPCAKGSTACRAGAITCEQRVFPQVEVCNGLDDNCNVSVDENFSLNSDGQNCGACNRVCAQGSGCLNATCLEMNCADGLDNDNNGASDCADQNCFQVACGGGTSCGTIEPRLLDGGTLDAGQIDAGFRDAGSLVSGCFGPETVCDDNEDNDGDLKVDCADLSCGGLACAPTKVCRDGQCLVP